jgi:hypothetical protein
MKSALRWLAFVVREVVSLTFWLFIFTKIFVYDVDLLIIRKITWLQRLYPYKFFLIIAVVACVWLVFGGKYARKTILYLAAYPFILIWRIIKIGFKNWAILVLFAPALESIVLTLKWRFILSSFALLAALGISLFTSRLALAVCMILLGLYLLLHFTLRLRMAYRPDSIFANMAPVIGAMWEQSVQTFKDAETAEQKKHIQNLKSLYIHSLLWTHFATKLRQAVSSRRTDLYFIVALIYTFILTVIVFGFEYWALFKINPSSFMTTGGASAWAFFLFSFNAILHTGFTTVSANSTGALVIANLELVAGLVIGLFFVFILFTSQRERYRQDFTTIVEQLTRSASQIESFLDRELGMKPIEVEVTIIKDDPTFTETLQYLGRVPPPIAPPEPSG